MTFWEIVAAVALGSIIVPIIVYSILLIVWGIIAIPCSIVEYVVEKREDNRKTKELIAKGADPNKFFVKNGIIYNK